MQKHFVTHLKVCKHSITYKSTNQRSITNAWQRERGWDHQRVSNVRLHATRCYSLLPVICEWHLGCSLYSSWKSSIASHKITRRFVSASATAQSVAHIFCMLYYVKPYWPGCPLLCNVCMFFFKVKEKVRFHCILHFFLNKVQVYWEEKKLLRCLVLSEDIYLHRVGGLTRSVAKHEDSYLLLQSRDQAGAD